ncbi:MAG: multidrug effflux MFS transporter [Desulfobulbaceae bacterium]|jgi:DHA1 family bicyclomycin/chloramphenicol resistance-like MFS transporter|nr:multidrug effflux MFS transporter [Desulfobulbaceae bacterium]
MKRKIALIALLCTFPPMSTDMYLAALPMMAKEWSEPLAVINLTLVLFFVAYCVGMLVYGPLSDRYGRKAPLLAGLAIYSLSSIACALAPNAALLIIARIFQGLGGAAASTIVFAICKDLFDGPVRQRLFVQLGVITAGAPILAPIVGGWVISLLSWRWIFVALALLGLLSALGVAMMDETLKQREDTPFIQAFNGYFRLCGNAPFMLLTLSFASTGLPLFAFLAASSDIYISHLGYNEHQYGLFFAANASAFLIAPLVFMRAVKRFSLRWLLPISYFGVLMFAAFMVAETLAHAHNLRLPFAPPYDLPLALPQPLTLAAPMWLLTFSFSFGRPPGNNLILEQVKKDVGAASSLMVFVYFITGALAMWIISQDWADKIAVLGWLGVGGAAITICGWFAARRLFRIRL